MLISSLAMAIGIIIARRVHIEVDKQINKFFPNAGKTGICIPSLARMLGLGDGYYIFNVGDIAFTGTTVILWVVSKFLPVIKPLVIAFAVYQTLFEVHELVFGTLFVKENEPIPPMG